MHAIKLKGLTKAFGQVIANSEIDLAVRQGEILALLGENGSGKTTLMNMLSGLYHPDAGSIMVAGREVQIRSPHDAIALGIGMIHQHFKLVDALTVEENILLGTKKRSGNPSGDIAELMRGYDMTVPLDRKVFALSVGEKQTVEIIKVLYRGAGVLILDEPTAVLTPQETQKLFGILRRMRDAGSAIIIITHKLNEVMEISDRVTILRRGKSVATVNTADTSIRALTEMMVGRPVDLSIHRPEPMPAPTKLSIHHLEVLDEEGMPAIRDISFEMLGGEILGVAGVAGSGQKELCEAIAGLANVTGGAILYEKHNIVGLTPRQIIDRGISMSFIPEDRLGMGLVGSMGMVDNMMLKDYRATSNTPLVSRRGARALATKLVDELSIVTPSITTPVRQLSGGNVQKVLLGREIASGPHILITAYPVRGLDINSSFAIYRMLNEQKGQGVAVLYIGEDLDVLLELSDRIMVLCGGKITGMVDAHSVTKEQLGLMMTGMAQEEAMTHG